MTVTVFSAVVFDKRSTFSMFSQPAITTSTGATNIVGPILSFVVTSRFTMLLVVGSVFWVKFRPTSRIVCIWRFTTLRLLRDMTTSVPRTFLRTEDYVGSISSLLCTNRLLMNLLNVPPPWVLEKELGLGLPRVERITEAFIRENSSENSAVETAFSLTARISS